MQWLKSNKILVAVIVGVAAAVDFTFGLGMSESVIEFLTSP